MSTPYNRIAGQSLERLAALSDGVFAIVMTLLVLDLHVPEGEAIQAEHHLWRELIALAPQLIAFLMSFLTLGIFWSGQQTQFNHLARSNRDFTWIHIAFLAGVSIMPFSTRFLSEFITYRTALILYWANILFAGFALYAGWAYASRAGLVRKGTPSEVSAAITQWIIVAQALYATGALLSIIHTYWSIALIVLVQLNYAVAPAIRWLRRLT